MLLRHYRKWLSSVVPEPCVPVPPAAVRREDLPTTRHSRFRFACGCPVSTIRRPGHISGERLVPRATSALFRQPSICQRASLPPVGALETSGVVIHFILRALVVLVLALLVKTPCPAGTFKGVVFCHHGRRTDLCAVAELADAEGAHLGTGVRIPGDLKDSGR